MVEIKVKAQNKMIELADGEHMAMPLSCELCGKEVLHVFPNDPQNEAPIVLCPPCAGE